MQRLQETKHVLGSDGVVTIVAADHNTAQPVLDALWTQVAAFEQRFSRFLPNSELTMCNQNAGRKTTVSPTFRAILVRARDMAEKTSGLYNPFVLPALQRAGYKGSWPQPAQSIPGTVFETGSVAKIEDLVIGDTWMRMPKSAALDFGGIGKGYLLDELATYLDDQPDVTGYWLSLGGDIICHGRDADGEPWRVGIQHALQLDEAAAMVANTDDARLAIATSGITKRKGFTAGKAWHHLIDPRTGRPAETDVLTATVCMPSATDADVYAKCLVLLGSKRADSWLRRMRIPTALVQHESERGVILDKIGDLQ